MSSEHARRDSATEQTSLLASDTSSTLSNDSEGNVSRNTAPKLSKLRASLIVLSLYLLIFLLTSNISLFSTIQSSIATELKATSSVTWFASAYLISITSITPVAGRLCQIFTPRVYLLASIVVKALGLLVTSTARSIPVFLVGRVLTGVGGAAITPVAIILVTELTSQRRRGLFFGMVNIGYTSGVACGAIIAGALEPAIGWRAVFWLQIPILLAAVGIAFFAIPKPPTDMKKSFESSTTAQKLRRIDYFGLTVLVLSVVLLLYSFSSQRIKITPILLSLAALVLFIFIEAKWAHEPIVPLSILKSRGNILSGLATTGLMSARWGVLFYTPVYAIALRGFTQAEAGLLLIPTNVGFALGGILVGWIHIRRSRSYWFASIIVFLLFAVTMVCLSVLCVPETKIAVYVTVLLTNGFFTGALLNYSLAHVLFLTAVETHIIVIPVNTMFRSLSGSLGSSIFGGMFLRTLDSSLRTGFEPLKIPHREELIGSLLGTPLLVQKLSGVERDIAVSSYSHALSRLFLGGAILGLVMCLVQAGTGWNPPAARQVSDSLSQYESLSRTASREPVAN